MEKVDGRLARGDQTRRAVLRRAVDIASVDGLEGLSIGNLAQSLDMSKSGVYAHFGSKLDLQLATVEGAATIFHADVIAPALAAPPGLDRLVTVCDSFFDYLGRRTFPGGCFFAGAVLEMGTRPGPVKDRVAAFQDGLGELGYVEGQNLVIEARFAEGSSDRLAELATELVQLPVDVLAASTTPPPTAIGLPRRSN